MSNPLDQLACSVPEHLHPVCRESLVECLLRVYADGVLLVPMHL